MVFILKKILSAFLILLIASFSLSYSYADEDEIYPVDKIIGQENDCVILATIIGIENNSIQLSNEYEVYPKNSNLPSTITVDNFKYSYCTEHSTNYNNPKFGDNIIINLTKANGKFMVGTGAYKVDTVSFSKLKVLIPHGMQGEECGTQLLALAHYIRTDGKQTQYKYDGKTVISINDNKTLNDYEADYIAYNDIVENSSKSDPTKEDSFTNSKYFEFTVITLLIICLAMGGFLVNFITKKIIK